jgi:MYXO-CTERM domain-containing protein
MMRSRTLAVASASLLFGAAVSAPRRADACGGLFCNTTPVVQSEEAIIFDVDPPANKVTAIINIVYQGSAEEFVWVLPLQTAPESLETGSQQAFIALQQLTTPQYRITEFEDVGMCTDFNQFARGTAEDAAADLGGQNSPPSADPGVNVVSREEVGPYDTVVLEGEPTAVRNWLVDNGFLVTDAMMDLVTPYLAKGDTLLALKLLNDRDVGEIRPIEVTMSANISEKALEACVPIRLTAIAANTDMPITTYVFSDAGRAIPQNFFHAVINPLKIDWLNFGSNYRQLVADAVDEADAGHAFVTEFSGSPTILEDQVYLEGQFDLARLRTRTDLGLFLDELINQGLLRRPGVRPILEKYFQPVKDCPSCSPGEFYGRQIDPNLAVDEIEKDVINPDRRAQQIFDGRSYFTRLLTILDPEEMTVDPIFTYDPTLDEVSNIHNAKMIRYCGIGGSPGSAGIVIVLEDGRRIYFDGNGQPDRDLIDAMPNAERIEQLAEGLVVRDNSGQINDLLDDHNERNGGGCGCGSATEKTGAAGGAAGALLLGILISLRRRKR